MTRTGIISAAVVVACFGIALFAAADKPVVEKKVMVVPGNQAWTDTGLSLKPGDRVTITGSGKVCFNGYQPESCVGPDGWPRSTYQNDWPGDYAHCFDPLDQAGHAALIGGVENRNFAVGAQAGFKGKDGRLYLGINDCTLTGQHFPNNGKFSAVITVERAIVPTR